jgi:ubiquinone/menaquinone biosynthesis C-methylase UbiE
MKLNLGCGNKKKDGYIGIDGYLCDAVNLLADLEKELPFKDSSIEQVYLDNVIEHIHDIPAFMKEVHRICKDGAPVDIITPHFASISSWKDPTHVHHLSFFSFDHFEKTNVAHYTGGGFSVTRRRISFSGIMGNIGRLIYYISPKRYESTWCFIFRPGTLYFELEVKKT